MAAKQPAWLNNVTTVKEISDNCETQINVANQKTKHQGALSPPPHSTRTFPSSARNKEIWLD